MIYNVDQYITGAFVTKYDKILLFFIMSFQFGFIYEDDPIGQVLSFKDWNGIGCQLGVKSDRRESATNNNLELPYYSTNLIDSSTRY